MDTIKVKAGNTKMIAHRGLSGLETENTCAAFVAAGNRSSYYGIETDIHRTADGNFIIHHDPDTSRVGGKKLKVEETDFSTLQEFRLRDKDGSHTRADLRLPSLEEYIGICKRYGKSSVLELKSAFTEEEIREMIGRIEKMGWLDEVIFIAFDYENLLKVRKVKPGQRCQFLTEQFSENLLTRLIKDDIDLDIYYPALSEKDVKLCHENGVLVNVWTVDKKEDAERLIGWGVDFLTSNILEGEVSL